MAKTLKTKRLNVHNMEAGSLDPCVNIEELYKEIKTVLVMRPSDYDTIDCLINYRGTTGYCEPCPFPLQTADDFLKVVIRCGNLGSNSETINKRFNFLMIALSIVWGRVRGYRLSFQKRFYYSALLKVDTLIPHYEKALDVLSRSLGAFATKGNLFSSLFLHELSFMKLAREGKFYLSLLYGAVLDNEKNDLTDSAKDFFIGIENFVTISASFKTATLQHKYEEELKIQKEKNEILRKMAMNPNYTVELETEIVTLKEENKKIKNELEEDQRLKEQYQLEISLLRKDLLKKIIENNEAVNTKYELIKERDDSVSGLHVLEDQLIEANNENTRLIDENQLLKIQLADAHKREQEREKEDKEKKEKKERKKKEKEEEEKKKNENKKDDDDKDDRGQKEGKDKDDKKGGKGPPSDDDHDDDDDKDKDKKKKDEDKKDKSREKRKQKKQTRKVKSKEKELAKKVKLLNDKKMDTQRKKEKKRA